MSEPVTIVGAGPAGIAAAIVLRRHGVPVRIFEKYPDVGYRLSGDFQGLENWSTETDVVELLKGIGIEINFQCVPYYGGSVHVRGMKAVEVVSRRPIFYLVRRGAVPGSLDTGLRDQAMALGAEFVFNHRVNDCPEMSIIGTGPTAADILATGMTFTTSAEDMAVAVFDDEIAPRGYTYLLVHRGFGTMAAVLYGDFNRERECFTRMCEFFRGETSLDIRDEKRFAGYGTFFLRTSQVMRNGLYVGESAGFQDYLWGFGMRYAFLSGALAARSILEGADYDLLWKRELQPMLETSLVNRFLVERFGGCGYRYLARKLVSTDPCEFLRRHYNHSFGKHLLLPLARLVLRNRGRLRRMALRRDP